MSAASASRPMGCAARCPASRSSRWPGPASRPARPRPPSSPTRRRDQADTGRAAHGGAPAGTDRPVHPARGAGHPDPRPPPVPAAGRAVATGVLAAVTTAVVNELLSREPASRLYDAITMARPGITPDISHIPALDPALAGLVAYATMVGLIGRPAWRNALWVAVGVYSVVHVGVLHTPMLTMLITVLAGRAIGLAVRYVAGSTSQRPGALDIASALRSADLRVSAIRRVRPDCTRVAGSRHYAVTTADGAAGHRGVRPGPAGGGHLLPDLPIGAAARAGVAQRPAVGGPGGRAPGAAVLRGRGRRRAHAAAARRHPRRPGSRRARLRAPRRDHAGPAQSRVQRRRAHAASGTRSPGCTPAR